VVYFVNSMSSYTNEWGRVQHTVTKQNCQQWKRKISWNVWERRGQMLWENYTFCLLFH